MTKFEPASFEEAINLCVVPIDEHLSERRVPIPDRVLQAALIFVENNIVDIRGDSKDDFIQKEWFQFIFRTIRGWYENKYGAALNRLDQFLIGACEIAGAFFQIRVPRILRRVEKPGETVWVVFPIDLQPEEDPRKWFVAPPNFDALDASVGNAALKTSEMTGKILRSIHCDLMMAERPDDISSALASKIQAHVRLAAEHLTDVSNQIFGLVAWESHQAIESALKLLTRQLKGSHATHHDLVQLFHGVGGSVANVDEAALQKMPSSKRIIEMRAGEGCPVNAQEAYEIYETSIELTSQVTAAMPGKFRMKNAAFLIKKAPFV